jgi:hypothetical protein
VCPGLAERGHQTRTWGVRERVARYPRRHLIRYEQLFLEIQILT